MCADSKSKKIEISAPLALPEESDVEDTGPSNLQHDPAAQSLQNEKKPAEKAEAPVTKKLGGLITLTEVALKRLQDGPYSSDAPNGSTFYVNAPVERKQMPGAYMKATVKKRAAKRIRDIIRSKNRQIRRVVPPPVPAESEVQYADVNILDRNTDCGSCSTIGPPKPPRTFATGEVTRSISTQYVHRIRDIIRSKKRQLRGKVPPPVPAESEVPYADFNILNRNSYCGSCSSIVLPKPPRTQEEVTRSVSTQYMVMTGNGGNRENSNSGDGLETQEKRTDNRGRNEETNCMGGGQPNPFIREHAARRSENLHLHKYTPVSMNRNSTARSSCHSFNHRRSEQKPEVPPRVVLRNTCVFSSISDLDFQSARSGLDKCKKRAYDNMRLASIRLNHLRLTKKVTREELEREVDLLVASETYNTICQYQEQPKSIPSHWWQNTATVTLRDLTFSIRRPHPPGNIYEHFVCVVSYENDVRATELTYPEWDAVSFNDVFQFQTLPTAFTITVKVYSTQENDRTNIDRTKHYLQKVFNARKIAASNVVYHGSLTITQRHLQVNEGGSFCHAKSSRIGRASLRLSMIHGISL